LDCVWKQTVPATNHTQREHFDVVRRTPLLQSS
jgi:hypothetical protein